MDERTIRSRRPIHVGHSGSYSPHGSPNTMRRNDRQMSPNFSGSEDDESMEHMRLDDYADTTADTTASIHSSPDVADGEKVEYSFRHRNVKFNPFGNVQEFSETKIKRKVTVPEKQKPSNHLPLVSVVLGLIIIVVAIYYATYHSQGNGNSRVAAEHRVQCSFKVSEQEFPKQNKILWKSLEHGVEVVLNDIPTQPSIFLLAYEDVDSANRITRSIVGRTTECMKSQVNALELSPSDLESSEMKSDYGIVITKYKNQLRKSGVMLVNDLNKVPTEVAPAFHSFCDVHNPLVDRSIIFLTLQLTRQIHSGSTTNTLQLVENYLRSNWSGLQSNLLEPLITRVTEHVFVLNKE